MGLYLPLSLLLPFFLLSTVTAGKDKIEWWQKSPIYQVYPYSFMDTDDNGIGDLKGVTNKSDHFKDLGIGGVWLSPIYESPGKDNGYDVSNFTNINPIFGNFDDFKELVKKLTKLGVKLIMDFVPNHSSDEHMWFVESRKNNKNDNKYRDYYVWRDPKRYDKGHPVPPNNWKSIFGGSAWEYVPTRKQYYFHTFGVYQPDLNYNNSGVISEMQNVLKFWLDEGVYGFRVDAVPYLVEDSSFKDEPESSGCNNWNCMNHTYTVDQSETYDVLAKFRETLSNYEKSNNTFGSETRLMMVEAYTTINNTMRYYGDDKNPIAHFPFNFFLLGLKKDSTGLDFTNSVQNWMDNMPKGQWPNWVLGNHDNSRVGSRLDKELIDGMNMMSLLLPGTSITYYGEEIGMTDTFISPDQKIDDREPERTPFQWKNSKNGGFSNSNNYTYLPLNPNYYILNLEQQKKDDKSHYKIYKNLVELHKKLIGNNTLHVSNLNDNYTFSFMRLLSDSEKYVVVLNLDSKVKVLNVKESYKKEKLPEFMFVHTVSLNTNKSLGDSLNITKLVLWPKESIVLASSATLFQSSVFIISIVFTFLLHIY